MANTDESGRLTDQLSLIVPLMGEDAEVRAIGAALFVFEHGAIDLSGASQVRVCEYLLSRAQNKALSDKAVPSTETERSE